MTDTTKLVDEVLTVFKETNVYTDQSEDALRQYIKGFCDAGQCVVARTEQGTQSSKPFAVALWARLDDAATKDVRRADYDIVSQGLHGLNQGDHPWFVDVISHPKSTAVFLESSAKSVFPGEDIHVRLRDESGTSQIIAMKQK